jgi:hypothetical protein
MVLKGACLRDAVRYEASEPAVTAVRHCKHRQRISGSALSVNVLFADAKVNFQGKTHHCLDTVDSGGRLQRRFCPTCGSPLCPKADALPGLTIVKAGTLDDTSTPKPSIQLDCSRAQPWAPLAPDTRNHPLAMS